MTFTQIFSSLFSNPKSKVKCQLTHVQRQQNQKFSQQLQALDLQSIRKQHGKLDPRYEKVIDEANIESVYRVEKYMKQFRTLLQSVDNYCNKNKSHKYGDKKQCVEEMDGLILDQFEKPFIKSQLNLYKVANLCLIKGQNLDKCVQQVKKQNNKSLEEGLKSLKQLVKNNCH